MLFSTLSQIALGPINGGSIQIQSIIGVAASMATATFGNGSLGIINAMSSLALLSLFVVALTTKLAGCLLLRRFTDCHHTTGKSAIYTNSGTYRTIAATLSAFFLI